MNTIVNILAKAAVLLVILFCIFFIIYPHACQNLSMGRMEPDAKGSDAPASLQLSSAAGREADKKAPIAIEEEEDDMAGEEGASVEGIKDTNTMQSPKAMEGVYVTDNPFESLDTSEMTQDEYDYLVIQRYAALEERYLALHPNDKDSAVAIAAEVMKEAALDEADWQEILAKATENNWFDKARKELKAKAKK